MLKLIWKDSPRFKGSTDSLPINLLLIYTIYINLLVRDNSTLFEKTILITFMFILLFISFFPVRLAKGLYLCPLTENDRKRYLLTACYIKFGQVMFVYGLVLILCGIFLEVNRINLVLQFISGGFIIFFMIISGMVIYINPMEKARQRYYAQRNIPVPDRPKLRAGISTGKTDIGEIITIVLTIILGIIGVIIPLRNTWFNPNYLFYYVPSFIVSSICVIIFYIKYLDRIITACANREIFEAKKRKVGVFNAD